LASLWWSALANEVSAPKRIVVMIAFIVLFFVLVK
jgi:hypothetical protein